MSPFKSEADFQTRLLDHIKKKGGFGFKIADSDCRLKPADCVTTYGDITAWLELKYKGDSKGFMILQHQENSCRRVWAAGGKYFFILYDATKHKIEILHGFLPTDCELTEEEILYMLGLHDFIS